MKSNGSTKREGSGYYRVVLLAICGALVLTTGVPSEVSGTDLPSDPFSIEPSHQVLGELAPDEKRTVVFSVVVTDPVSVELMSFSVN